MKKRTVHTRRGSMVLDIQRKVTVAAFHKKQLPLVCSVQALPEVYVS